MSDCFVSFRDISRVIMDDRSLSSDQLLFLIEYVLDYLHDNNMQSSYEVLCDARYHLVSRVYDKMEGGE